MNIDQSEYYREKYRKKLHGKTMQYPAGGQDVNNLCDIVDRLYRIIRYFIGELPPEMQNKIERDLWFCAVEHLVVTPGAQMGSQRMVRKKQGNHTATLRHKR